MLAKSSGKESADIPLCLAASQWAHCLYPLSVQSQAPQSYMGVLWIVVQKKEEGSKQTSIAHWHEI